MSTTPKMYTAKIRARATAYVLAVARNDEHRHEMLADLTQDELLHVFEGIALIGARTMREHTRGAEVNTLERMLRLELQTMNNTDSSQEGS
ncbi:hypothetical protein GCM10027060_18860 [Nesterenkonia halophila]|uniref:hypothetical protein n=1 Tax=Nesterenkonia halophila TaxID=302044 RepID=UPI001291B2E2|nr:hypothetical protein [Nesterenkonia halophila]